MQQYWKHLKINETIEVRTDRAVLMMILQNYRRQISPYQNLFLFRIWSINVVKVNNASK